MFFLNVSNSKSGINFKHCMKSQKKIRIICHFNNYHVKRKPTGSENSKGLSCLIVG
mgnify:CR=1 FL=1